MAGAVPAEAQETRPALVLAGTLIDGTGSPPQLDVAILLRDGRIVEIRPATAADATAPGAVMKAEWS